MKFVFVLKSMLIIKRFYCFCMFLSACLCLYVYVYFCMKAKMSLDFPICIVVPLKLFTMQWTLTKETARHFCNNLKYHSPYAFCIRFTRPCVYFA